MFLKVFVLTLAIGACWAASPKIVRPCRLTDLKCITDNLKANSRCNSAVSKYLPNKYTLKNVRFETPYFNSSYIDKTLIVRNHDKCVVSEFYYNIDKDTAVFSLDCPRLDLESERKLIQHNSKKEDTEYHYHIRGEYPLIRLTVNLRHADRMDLCSAFVFADVTALPVFRVDPLDKPTGNFLSRDLSVLNVYERETFFCRAPMLMRFYINAYICNFGCS